MSDLERRVTFLASFLFFVAVSAWYFYPMRGWTWMEWFLTLYSIPGIATLVGLFVCSKADSIIFERRLKKEQKKTKILLSEIKAKKK